ncbi:MAG: hypothetical protein HKN48_00235 [Flavobacteriaceae bacterium]|nr:hypothetical protein [Flavobacteriaceae bacterium]
MKKEKWITFTLFLAVAMLLLIGCNKDDGGVTPTDDTIVDPVDDITNPPQGFLGELDFVLTYGGSGTDTASDMVEATDGSYVIVGTTESTDGDITDKTETSKDVWVLKVDAQGQKIWSKTYGGTNNDVGNSINHTSDGGYIISGYSRSTDGDVSGNEGFQDYWILKIDADGNVQWDKNYGFLGGEQAFNTFQTEDGGYFAGGFLDVTGSGGAGNDDGRSSRHGVGEFWGIKMNSNGDKVWRRYFGGSNNDRCYDALQTEDGGFLMIGASESFDFDITDDKGSYDYWVVRVDDAGNLLWTKSFGGLEIDIAYGVTHSKDGNYIIVGDARSTDQDVSNPIGNADLWVVKFRDDGSMIWEKSLGGTAFDSAKNIYPLDSGSYVISGSSRSSDGDVSENKGENDAWVLIIDSNGALQFEMSIGGAGLDFGNHAMETSDNKIILVGDSTSNDGNIPQNRGSSDFMVVKIK